MPYRPRTAMDFRSRILVLQKLKEQRELSRRLSAQEKLTADGVGLRSCSPSDSETRAASCSGLLSDEYLTAARLLIIRQAFTASDSMIQSINRFPEVAYCIEYMILVTSRWKSDHLRTTSESFCSPQGNVTNGRRDIDTRSVKKQKVGTHFGSSSWSLL